MGEPICKYLQREVAEGIAYLLLCPEDSEGGATDLNTSCMDLGLDLIDEAHKEDWQYVKNEIFPLLRQARSALISADPGYAKAARGRVKRLSRMIYQGLRGINPFEIPQEVAA